MSLVNGKVVEASTPIVDNEVERKKYEWLDKNSSHDYGANFWGKPYVSFINQMTHHPKISRLLDLGTGRGQFCKSVSENYKKVYGLDWSITPGEDCRADNVEYIKADAQFIPLDNNSVDITTSFDFFEHIIPDNVSKVIDESVRVTTSFIFHHIMLNRSSVANRNRLVELFGDGELHQTRKDSEWWRNMFEKYGKVLVLDVPPYHNCFLIILGNEDILTADILSEGWY